MDRLGGPTVTLTPPPAMPVVMPPKVRLTPGIALLTVFDGDVGWVTPLIVYCALVPAVAVPCRAIEPALSDTVEGARGTRGPVREHELPLTTVPHTVPVLVRVDRVDEVLRGGVGGQVVVLGRAGACRWSTV